MKAKELSQFSKLSESTIYKLANGHMFAAATIPQVTDSFSEVSVPEPFMRR